MKGTRWIVLSGSFIAYMFDALEILLLAMALPTIREDMGLTQLQGGLLATATLLGIGVSAMTVGLLSDNFGRKKALLASLISFGIFTAALSIVPDFTWFLMLRFLAGLGLGGVWSVASSYVVETWPVHLRGRAVAFVLSSFPVGGILAAELAGVMLPDWRTLFFVAGVGVVIPVAFIAVFFRESEVWQADRDERRLRRLTVDSKSSSHSSERVSLGRIFEDDLRRPTILATLVCALALTGWWGGSTWIPTYLIQERGVDPATVATFMTVLNLGLFVGYNVFGVVADHIGRRNATTLSLAGVAVTLPLYALTRDAGLLLWFGPLFAFFAAFSGIFGSFLAELYPTEIRTTGAGFCFNVGRGVSALAPFTLAALATSVGISGGLIVCAVSFGLAALLTLALPHTERLLTVSPAPRAVPVPR